MTVDDEGGILFGDFDNLETEVYLCDFEIDLDEPVYIPKESLQKNAYETLIRLKLRRE